MALKEWRDNVREKEFWRAMGRRIELDLTYFANHHDKTVYPEALQTILLSMLDRAKEAGNHAVATYNSNSRIKDAVRAAFAAEGMKVKKIGMVETVEGMQLDLEIPPPNFKKRNKKG